MLAGDENETPIYTALLDEWLDAGRLDATVPIRGNTITGTNAGIRVVRRS